MGSRLELWCFLVDFFFLAVLELPCADEALDCCGLHAVEAAIAGNADVEHAQASDARNSDVAMRALVIVLRFSSLPRGELRGTKRPARTFLHYDGFPAGLKLGHLLRRVSSNRRGT